MSGPGVGGLWAGMPCGPFPVGEEEGGVSLVSLASGGGGRGGGRPALPWDSANPPHSLGLAPVVLLEDSVSYLYGYPG